VWTISLVQDGKKGEPIGFGFFSRDIGVDTFVLPMQGIAIGHSSAFSIGCPSQTPH